MKVNWFSLPHPAVALGDTWHGSGHVSTLLPVTWCQQGIDRKC